MNAHASDTIQELMSDKEKAMREADKTTDWREVANPNGKLYYFNQKTRRTTWELPEELRKAREATGYTVDERTVVPKKTALPDVAGAAGRGVTPAAPAAHIDVPSGAPHPTTDDGKVDVFKSLLEGVGVQVDWTWETTMRQIITDKRYAVLKNVAEKKRVFREYIDALKERKRQEETERLRTAREGLRTMLVRKLAANDIREGMRWREVEASIQMEEEFTRAKDALGAQVEDAATEVLKEIERDERERRRELSRKLKDAFREALGAEDWITFETSWRHVLTHFFNDDGQRGRENGTASSTPAFTDMDRTDALEVFQMHQSELEKKERERIQVEKESRLNCERRNRDVFSALLVCERDAGQIHARSRWKDFFQRIKEHPSYVAVSNNLSGSTPRELFREVVEDEYIAYKEDRKAARDAMRTSGFTCKTDTTLEEFRSALQAAMGVTGAKEKMSAVNTRLLWEDEVEVAREEQGKEARRVKRVRGEFADALRSLRMIGVDTPWDEALGLLQKEEEELLTALNANGENLEALYSQHISYLKKRIEERGEAGEEGEVLEDESDKEFHRRERSRRERKRGRHREERDTMESRPKRRRSPTNRLN